MILYDNDFIVLCEAIYAEVLVEIARDHNIPHAVALSMATDLIEKLRELKDESDCEGDEYL